jgi:hypothetical protein
MLSLFTERIDGYIRRTDMETERVKFIRHQEKEILFLDFSNSGTEEVLKIIEDAKRVISTKPENSLLTLTDVTNARFNEEVGEGMKQFTAHNKPYVKAAAVVGITGLKRVIFGAVMAFSKRNLQSFDDMEQAKHWLINN